MMQDEKGFTIVESIITIVVIGIVAGSIWSLFASIHRIQRQAVYMDTATRSAQQEIETLRNNNYSTLTPGEDIDFTDQLPENLPSPKTGTVEVSEPLPELRRVNVEITYTDGGISREVRLSSLIGVIGISQ